MGSDTKEIRNIKVTPEEVTKQRHYIEEIKHMNAQQEMQSGRKRYYNISTYGCQMNENDSERLAGMLSGMGYMQSDKLEDCELIIFNTCCVRENAEFKVFGHLGELKKLKEKNRGLIIAVCGCMMQQPEVVEKIKTKYRQVSLIFGTHNLFKFPELLYNTAKYEKSIIAVEESEGNIAEGMPIERKDGIKAWVTIMYGCDNFCSYCIVPYVRGRERSRNASDILDEIRLLGHQGYKEITLLGQNVNSYGKDKNGIIEANAEDDIEEEVDFPKLIRKINEIENIQRVRFMTSHPKDLSDELIYAIRDCSKVCRHIHLPIQSGSTRILHEMNRKYTKEDYLKLVGKIRENIPGIALTTDIIVGFPGETEEDFLETLDIIENVKFDFVYTFLYSKRTGTPAAKHNEQVPEDVKQERFERLVKLQNDISKQINDSFVCHKVEVLVEGLSKNSNKSFTGRTGTNKVVNFKADKELVGTIVNIEVEKAQTWSLEGTIVD